MPMTERQEVGVLIMATVVVWVVISVIMIMVISPLGGHWECIGPCEDMIYFKCGPMSGHLPFSEIGEISSYEYCYTMPPEIIEPVPCDCDKWAWVKGGS